MTGDPDGAMGDTEGATGDEVWLTGEAVVVTGDTEGLSGDIDGLTRLTVGATGVFDGVDVAGSRIELASGTVVGAVVGRLDGAAVVGRELGTKLG